MEITKLDGSDPPGYIWMGSEYKFRCLLAPWNPGSYEWTVNEHCVQLVMGQYDKVVTIGGKRPCPNSWIDVIFTPSNDTESGYDIYFFETLGIDLHFQGLGETEEETEGGWLAVNNDFDEQNHDSQGALIPDNQPDHAQGHGIVGTDGEVESITVQVTNSRLFAGDLHWRLTFPDKIKIWKWDDTQTPPRYVEVVSGQAYDVDGTWTATDFYAGRGRLLEHTFKVEGITPSAAERDISITGTFTADGAVGLHSDTVKVTCVDVDLDIDSDNDNGFGAPDRDAGEDRIEDISGDPDTPSKFVALNHDDNDNDGIPDFADGFDWDEFEDNADDATAGEAFTPLVLELPASVDLTKAKVRITYDASDPADVQLFFYSPDYWIYAPGSGRLRIWTKPGAVARDSASIDAETPGDYVPDGEYDAADLGLQGGTRVVTLYVEAIALSSGVSSSQVSVELDPDGDGPAGFIAPDAVRMTCVRVDLDVDSDNDNGADSPERDATEDQIEDVREQANRAGKFVAVNQDDSDNDGIPDFADGYDWDDTEGNDDDLVTDEVFTPVVLHIPAPLDPAEVRVRVTYEASDPAAVTRTGTAPDYVYAPAAGGGRLRVWTEAGTTARDPASIDAEEPGHYVPNGEYAAADFGLDGTTREVTLYIEGVAASAELSSNQVLIEVDPDGDGHAGFMVPDAVRISCVQVDLDVDTDNDNAMSDPERDAVEDHVEDVSGNPERPGKFIAMDYDDDDNDGVPDFADGYNWDGTEGNDDDVTTGEEFVPLVFEVLAPLDLTQVKVRVTYEASDPTEVTLTGVPPDEEYVPDSGRLRVWTEAGATERNPASIGAEEPGHYVPNGEYDASDFGLGETTRQVTLYIEGIAPSDSVSGSQILIEIDPDGDRAAGFMVVDAVRTTAIRVDIDCDTNRNGDVEDDDEREEELWSSGPDSRGAIVLPNCDDDDSNHLPDNWIGGSDFDYDGTDEAPDTVVNPDPDRDDLSQLVVHRLGVSGLPPDLRVVLRVVNPTGDPAYFSSRYTAEQRARVFLPTLVVGNDLVVQPGDADLLGPEAGFEVEFVESPTPPQRDYSIFEGGGIVEMGLEGIQFGAMVDAVLEVYKGTNLLYNDRVRFKVAPFVVLSHTDAVSQPAPAQETVYIEDMGADNAALRGALGGEYGACLDQTSIVDIWHQDGYEIGYSSAPYKTISVILGFPRGQRTYGGQEALNVYTRQTLLRSDVGLIHDFQQGAYTTHDMGGNLEAIPGAPGSFLYGSGLDTDMVDFLEAQEVQTGTSTNVGWLLVGHIDEVVSFAPDGVTTLVADPELCWALLVIADSINPTASMLQRMDDPSGTRLSSRGMPVHNVVNHSGLRTFNFNTVMDPANLPTVRSDLGLGSPTTSPVAAPGNTGTAVLEDAGALVGYFPDNNTRDWRLTFTNDHEYAIEHQVAGGAWTADGTGDRLQDSVSDSRLAFVLRHWWGGGAPVAGDIFTFSTDPTGATLELPVLFRSEGGSALAFTNNVTNCLVDGNDVFVAQTYGPHVDIGGGAAVDILEDYVDRMLGRAGYTDVHFCEERVYHNNAGSIHCGTNVRRSVSSPNWWEW